MRVLIVGAGQVGQAYGFHLKKGGAHVAYFVKPKYAEAARAGFTIYPLPKGEAGRKFHADEVFTDWAEVATSSWDYVLLAVASDALRGDWFDEMLETTGDATVVTVRHGIGDSAYLREKLGSRRHTKGVTSFFAFAYPMGASGDDAPGTAVWVPPFLRVLFESEEKSTVAPLIKGLDLGGMSARYTKNADMMLGTGEFILSALAIMFELCDWSLAEAAARPEDVRLALDAGREQGEILRKEEGLPPPAFRALLTPKITLMLIKAFDLGMPFSFAEFMRSHYGKLHAQGEHDRRVFEETGRRLGLPVEKIVEVRRRLADA
jgi:2-dehydropantoate 2-reductase